MTLSLWVPVSAATQLCLQPQVVNLQHSTINLETCKPVTKAAKARRCVQAGRSADTAGK
jgi:hypothetical protein